MGKMIIAIILVNIEITIIQTIIFEFENMMYLFSMSLLKTLSNWELHVRDGRNVYIFYNDNWVDIDVISNRTLLPQNIHLGD